MWKSIALLVAVCLLAAPGFAGDKGAPKTVELRGKLRTHVFAIGGETTGTEIQTKEGKYELDFGKESELRKKADKLDGKEVVVKGTLEVRKGVEVKERKIIKVRELKEADKK